MSDFLKDIIKETGNEYASLVSDGASGDVDSFIDTGSYIKESTSPEAPSDTRLAYSLPVSFIMSF